MFDEDLKDISNVANKPIDDLVHSVQSQVLEPDLPSEYVDVRDVARADLLAFQRDSAEGQRLTVSAGKFSLPDIVDILKHTFPQLQGEIAQGRKPESVEEASERRIDTEKTSEILGITYRTLKETVYDVTKQILKTEEIF